MHAVCGRRYCTMYRTGQSVPIASPILGGHKHILMCWTSGKNRSRMVRYVINTSHAPRFGGILPSRQGVTVPLTRSSGCAVRHGILKRPRASLRTETRWRKRLDVASKFKPGSTEVRLVLFV
jgi:hypothetical protein